MEQKDWQPCLLAFQQQDYNKTIQLADELIQRFPDFAFAYKAKGVSLYNLGNIEDSKKCLETALQFDPNDVDILNNLAMLYARNDIYENLWKTAEQYLLKALKIAPTNLFTYVNLVIIYARLSNWNQLKIYADYILKNQKNIDIISQQNNNQLIEILTLYLQAENYLGNVDAAQKIAEQITKLTQNNSQKGNGNIHYFLAEIYENKKQYLNAINELQLACQKNPTYIKNWTKLALILGKIGETNAAKTAIDFATKLTKTNPNVELGDKINAAFLYLSNDLYQYPQPDISIIQQHVQNYANLISEKCPTLYNIKTDFEHLKNEFFHFTNTENSKKNNQNLVEKNQTLNKKFKLKIGFVSADLNGHVVSKFLLNLFNVLHKNNSFDLYIYSNSKAEDNISLQLQRFCKSWTPIQNLPDKNLAQKIYADKIHILFDLSGLTTGNRLSMFAYKPAPIQISWIGWLGSSAISTMDYFLADEFCVPRNEKYEQQFIEKVLRMPDIWEVLTPPKLSEIFSLQIKQNLCNTEKNFIFGSFNNPNKVGTKTLDLWCTVLKKSPENTQFIWLRDIFSDNEFKEKIFGEFRKRGISENQIVLKNYENHDNYLKTFLEIDLILDSFPFSGMTTTAEGLSLGIPTLTLLGNLMSSRLSGSCINAIGDANLNKNFIFDNENDFINQAVFFANNLQKLNELKTNLAEKARKSPLCDAELFAKNFEIQMWNVWKDFVNS